MMRLQRGRYVPLRTAGMTLMALVCLCSVGLAQSDAGQAATPETTAQKVERLAAAVSQVQAQMEANQKLLLELRAQLAALQQQMASETSASPAADLAKAVDEIREKQAIDESQIATHELTKIESRSKYPLTVSGLILFNGFVNTRPVDIAASPAYAVPGSGNTGISLRQTVLGLDARGPRLMGAKSHADVRVDFFGSGSASGYSAGGMLRLRTAHAGLQWLNSEITAELDRSILVPEAPTSLLAVGQPELAWAGNLWTWNPQLVAAHWFGVSDSFSVQAQVGLIAASDPHLPSAYSNASNVTLAERSRWPGTEARISFEGNRRGAGPVFGIGGYFSPHRTADSSDFNAWAGTADLRLPMSRYFVLTANAYRGQALGGLGGGGYVDYYYRPDESPDEAHALDDVGGWAQLKAKPTERVEFNTGYGIDNPFAKEVQLSITPPLGPTYPGLAKNRSYFGNVIYSPSAYLQFSLEYRRFWSNFARGPIHISDVIGIGAGYNF